MMVALSKIYDVKTVKELCLNYAPAFKYTPTCEMHLEHDSTGGEVESTVLCLRYIGNKCAPTAPLNHYYMDRYGLLYFFSYFVFHDKYHLKVNDCICLKFGGTLRVDTLPLLGSDKVAVLVIRNPDDLMAVHVLPGLKP